MRRLARRFLFPHVELCSFEDHVSFDNEMLVEFIFYFSILPLFFPSESKALGNIVGLVAHAVDHCIYLQDFSFLLSSAQAAQTHYMNADVTLASEQCRVTNGYLQRLVWDRSVFLKRDKKCYVFK